MHIPRSTREFSKRTRVGIGAATFAVLLAAGLSTAADRGSAAQLDAGADRAVDPDSVARVAVDLSERTLKLFEGDSLVATYPVAIGRDSKPTPIGTFHIRRIIWNPSWVPPDKAWARGQKRQAPGAAGNPMKVVKIFFKEPDYYIHGTDALQSLGSAASHGCLRMDPDDAYSVARYVMEHGGQPRDENWFLRVLHFRRQTKTVILDNPIQLTVER